MRYLEKSVPMSKRLEELSPKVTKRTDQIREEDILRSEDIAVGSLQARWWFWRKRDLLSKRQRVTEFFSAKKTGGSKFGPRLPSAVIAAL